MAQAGQVPARLVGSWRYGAISPSNFWSDHGSTYSGNAYGFSDQYEFSRDGRFKEWTYIYTQSYGCLTQVWTYMEGTVMVSGSTITKYANRGRYKVQDTCSASRNFDRPMSVADLEQQQAKEYDWGMEEDGYTGERYLRILDGRYDPAD